MGSYYGASVEPIQLISVICYLDYIFKTLEESSHFEKGRSRHTTVGSGHK